VLRQAEALGVACTAFTVGETGAAEPPAKPKGKKGVS